MDGSYSTRPSGQATIPPLEAITTLGLLQYYVDGTNATPVRPEINGTIDKGFFLSDGEWTCYRRNYFSCVCSFSLSPHYQNTPLHFTQQSTQQTYTVQGFAMSISAVVADNEGHNIELVQHTPKRDKGPIMKPDKIRMVPKTPPGPHHPLVYHGHSDGGLAARGVYDPTYVGAPSATQSGGPCQMEHTFERIQFKHATANNGKRRAAQQYYQLVIELFAEVVPPGPEQWVRVAYRRSAKMIVRGRSPGHYHTDRRGSTSSGPGGGGGNMGGYANGPIMGPDFSSGGPMLGGGFAGGYDSRGPAMPPYGTRHHAQHDLPTEVMIPPEHAKIIENTKGYQYYPAGLYDSQQDSRSTVAGFSHPRSDRESTGFESKGKHDYDGISSPLPSIFQHSPFMADRRCNGFEGKPRSEGYYPSLVPQSGINIPSIT
jgi:meiosis-specific transcription factor NDT80